MDQMSLFERKGISKSVVEKVVTVTGWSAAKAIRYVQRVGNKKAREEVG